MSQLICGDARETLAGLDDDFVDLIVTDPPYGISFMGKDWDKAVPSADIWRECLRVLKPGAFAFVMSIPRMDCLGEMGRRLAEAGFETGFTPIFHAYASGFPKAQNIGKAVDKRGVWNDEFDNVRTYLRRKVKEKGLTHKEIDTALGNVNSHLASHYLGTSQPMLPDWDQWVIIKGLLGLDEDIDRPPKCIGFERAILGYRKVHKGVAFSSEGASELPITLPATPEAQALDGSYAGFQPKPAVEVVIVAMKPLAHGTYVDQALDNGKGVTWLDEGRIPISPNDGGNIRPNVADHQNVAINSFGMGPHPKSNAFASTGRFPANLLVSDDVLDDGRNLVSKWGHSESPGSDWFDTEMGGTRQADVYQGDSGSFSRYFSLDSWWQAKLSQLPEAVQRTFPFLIVPKAGKKEKNLGCEGLPKIRSKVTNFQAESVPYRMEDGIATNPKAVTYAQNHHPTVKPLNLMSYLITLGSRPGDLVLDPFAGTCTTGMAAKMLGRDWLMIEIDEQWCGIGKRRIEAVQPGLFAAGETGA